ncbi:SDR family NAD(P)-dependent oxidoreductase [Peribacillus simplex]|nr:SDR family NAD(P)-dependent oxidoreductase [Peribacillus simplex]
MKGTDLFDLTGKTAIITGGWRGLGVQIATGFVEAGANVVFCSRKKEACNEVASQIEKLGGRALSFKCDITNPTDVQEVVNETYREFIAIDILVNNSGASWGGSYVSLNESRVRRYWKAMVLRSFANYALQPGIC